MRFSYPWQKAYEAAKALMGTGTLEQRLYYAGVALSLFPLQQSPPETQRLARLAKNAFSKYPGTHPNGNIAGLIELLPEDRKRELATKVLDLYRNVCELNGAAEAGVFPESPFPETQLEGADKWEFLYWGTSTMSSMEEQLAYVKYAQHFLPNFPAAVLLEWLGRHGYEQMRRWAHLPLDQIRFERVEMSFEDIQTIQLLEPSEGFNDIGPNTNGAYGLQDPDDWLGRYIGTHGTWQYPLVVMESPVTYQGAECPVPAGRVLVEGHCRIGRLLNLQQSARIPGLKHEVWVGRV